MNRASLCYSVVAVMLCSVVCAQDARPKPAAPAAPAPPAAPAAPDQPRRGGQRGPVVVSPEVQADRKVTFRLLAPKAQAVRLSGGDLPGDPRQQRDLAKGEN